MISLDQHETTNLLEPTQTYTSTKWNEYENGSSTYASGVHKEVSGTITTTVSFTG